MKEKLIIKNFGPIKDVELELGRFNILIGEQATGKSTVAKVLAVCRYFSYILPSTDGYNFAKGLITWGIDEYIEFERTYISYTCGDYFFKAQHKILIGYTQTEDGPEEVPYPGFEVHLEALSSSFEELGKELNKINPNTKGGYGYYDIDWQPPTSFFQNEVALILDNPFYFPVERGLQSIFSLGRSSIQNISDTLFNQFAKLDQAARFFKADTIIEPLGITYKNDNGQGLIKSKNHDFVKIFNAASGYQSTIPVVLTIKYYNRTKKKGKTFIIEEPELNLFPNAQQKLMEFLVEQVTTYNNSLLLTTHSPYILTSLNNMLYAYQVGQNEAERTEKIIDKKYWLSADDVSAYILLPNGTCESILDKEEKLIKAEKIDEISGLLNEQFDNLLNVELVNS